jgi:single-strand DNA-binding protein
MGFRNKVQLVGYLGRDAVMRRTAAGIAVTQLSLGTTETVPEGGRRETRTDWHRVVLWGKRAEALQRYLVKGKQLHIEGQLRTRVYDTPEGEREVTEVHAEHVELLGGGDRRREVDEHVSDEDIATGHGPELPVTGMLSHVDIPF